MCVYNSEYKRHRKEENIKMGKNTADKISQKYFFLRIPRNGEGGKIFHVRLKEFTLKNENHVA